MSINIKSLKPRTGKSSHYKQGYFDVSKSDKYYGPTPVIYRSGLEFKFMIWCELSQRIKKWTSEPQAIPYTCPESGKTRDYFIDFIVQMSNGDKFVVEVKPYKQMLDAERFSAQASRMQKLPQITAVNRVAAKNDAKWKHAKLWCNQNNYKFIIITENFKFV